MLVPLLTVGTRIITLSFPLQLESVASEESSSRRHLQLLATSDYLPGWGASVKAFIYQRI